MTYSSSGFRHAATDDTTCSERELRIEASFSKATAPRLDVHVRVQFEGSLSQSKCELPRYRVRALVHFLQEWLDATEEAEEKP